jgi:hypothetical protein
MSQNDILFVHVEPGDEKLDPGDWFFHTGGGGCAAKRDRKRMAAGT